MAGMIDRYRTRLAAIPALSRFCEQAERLVFPNDPESFWSVEPAFQELLASDFVEAFVQHELSKVAEDDLHFMMGSSEIHSPIVESAGYALLIKLLPAEAASLAPISTLAEHLMLSVWGAPAQAQGFRVEEPFRHDVFDRSRHLIPTEIFDLVPGKIVKFHSPQDLFRLLLPGPTLMIHLQSSTTVPLRWIFHPETLEPVRAVASRLSSSRLQFTCHTLAALGSPSSIPALKKLMTHPEHYVRWAAVQGICSISREEGIECLRKSLEDDHPHIRNAALKSLANC